MKRTWSARGGWWRFGDELVGGAGSLGRVEGRGGLWRVVYRFVKSITILLNGALHFSVLA